MYDDEFFADLEDANKAKRTYANAPPIEPPVIEFADDSVCVPSGNAQKSPGNFRELISKLNGEGFPITTGADVDRDLPAYEEYSYATGFNKLLCRSEKWRARSFSNYSDFITDAKKFYKKTCLEAEYAYYFSYRPMYRELSHEQLYFYLHWRSAVRNNRYLKTGLSYIILYVYEQMSLSEFITPEKVLAEIISVWCAYRVEFPRLDKTASEWLIDFCLVSRIDFNSDAIRPFLTTVIEQSMFPEFYIPADFFTSPDYTEYVIKRLSLYDYNKSKHCAGENKEAFRVHINAVVRAVTSSAAFADMLANSDETASIMRESFAAAVVPYELKKKLTITYKKIMNSFQIKQVVTDTVRRAENACRMSVGIKAKLTTNLAPCFSAIIDEYISAHLQPKTPPAKKNHPDSHEEVYEPREFNADLAVAAAIESSSWETTKSLVEHYDSEDFTSVQDAPLESHDPIDEILATLPDDLTDAERLINSLTEEERAALNAIISGGGEAEFKKAYPSAFFETITAAINEKSADSIGDTIIENDELIADYSSDVIHAMQQ
ncbi:hypothetical protein FACS1894105_06590 [Clostridia bacterium]|nr:hypothetical protein FACS1894105_06590 [Clostridia bacterium]